MSILTESIEMVDESYLINEKDIYYNKDKFDSGEINLCFITGHSGSGKSTMAHNSENDNIEAYELDDLHYIADHFSMDNLKEYGDLIYSYFNGEGKKFYVTKDEMKQNNVSNDDYEDILYRDFVHYSMKYAKIHKDKKFILEGIWLFCGCDNGKGEPYFKPEEFKDYAFYIKGTSALISLYRSSKRDSSNIDDKKEQHKKFRKLISRRIKHIPLSEKQIRVFRKYFSKLVK